MPTCPAGHDSTDADFCDTCGMRIGGPAPAPAPTPDDAQAPAPATEPAAPAEPCPNCGTGRAGLFCEACGYDFSSGLPAPGPSPTAVPGPSPGPGPAPATAVAAPAPAWTAVVTADRAYFDGVMANGGPDAATIEFPAYCPERQFRLAGREMRIGRRSVSRGLEPEIDLTGPPADPGVSHLH